MRLIVIGLVLVALVGLGVWFVVGSSKLSEVRKASTHVEAPGEASQEQGGEGGPIKLSAEQRQAQGIKVEAIQARVPEEVLPVTGRIAANPERTVVIAPRVQGRVVKVQARLGDTVAAGATVALVDSVEGADALGELAQSESVLTLVGLRAEQQRQLHDAKLRVLETATRQPTAEAALRELEKVELGRAKQEYISALAKLELAQADYERQSKLVELKIGARKDLIRTEKEMLTARTELSAAAEAIRLSARQELVEAEAALQQARAQRDKVRGKLRLFGYPDAMLTAAGREAGQRPLMPLVAPFAGTVIEQQVSEGQLLDAGSVPFRLADLGTVWALLDVPENDAAILRTGQEVVVEAGRDAKISHTGRIVFIADVVDEATRTVKVRVEIPNLERHFKPGMFVSARIASRRPGPPRVMVPRAAVFLLDEGPVVFVDGEDGIRARPVKTGQEVGGWMPILEGVKAGETVVTEGGFALKAQLVKAKLGEE